MGTQREWVEKWAKRWVEDAKLYIAQAKQRITELENLQEEDIDQGDIQARNEIIESENAKIVDVCNQYQHRKSMLKKSFGLSMPELT